MTCFSCSFLAQSKTVPVFILFSPSFLTFRAGLRDALTGPTDCHCGAVPVQSFAFGAAFRLYVDVFGGPFMLTCRPLAYPIPLSNFLHWRHAHDCSASAHSGSSGSGIQCVGTMLHVCPGAFSSSRKYSHISPDLDLMLLMSEISETGRGKVFG